MDDYDLLLRMVAAGFGVGFIPELGLQFPSAKAVVVRRAAGVPLRRHIDALTRRTLATVAHGTGLTVGADARDGSDTPTVRTHA